MSQLLSHQSPQCSVFWEVPLTQGHAVLYCKLQLRRSWFTSLSSLSDETFRNNFCVFPSSSFVCGSTRNQEWNAPAEAEEDASVYLLEQTCFFSLVWLSLCLSVWLLGYDLKWAWRTSLKEVLCALEGVFLLNRNRCPINFLKFQSKTCFCCSFLWALRDGPSKETWPDSLQTMNFQTLWCSGENKTQPFFFILDFRMVFKGLSWQELLHKYIVENHLYYKEFQADGRWDHKYIN